MSAFLKSIDDPRDSLEKATRYELVAFAKANGLNEVSEAMPAILIRKALRSKNLVNIPIPNRVLGSYEGGSAVADFSIAEKVGAKVNTVDADDDLARQFAEAKADPSNMTMGELRAECKRRGIKMARTDTLKTLQEKLLG